MIDVRVLPADRTPDALAVPVTDAGPRLDGIPTAVLPLAGRAAVEALAAEGRAAAADGEVRELPRPGELPATLLVAGVGDESPRAYRRAGAALARAARGPALAVAVPALAGEPLTALVEGLALGAHRYRARSEQDVNALREAALLAGDADAVERGLVAARAGAWARDLTNTPAGTKTPAWLAEQAVAVLAPLGVRVQVRDEAWLAEHGFGGVLAVGGGAAAPPRLIEAAWRPRGVAAPHVVLVGKGITFDTGGLNLKPGESMRSMHTDMGGGAAVLGAVRVAAQRRLPVRVTALVPCAENAVSGSAMRPGDVIRHYGGRTTEVMNTDAEGRLVLGDALAYAAARLRPDVVVDAATLTGAMKVALGMRTAGVFATSDALAAGLIAAGAAADEPLWRMPLVDDYADQLDAPVADATNMPGNPGAITAALFLRPFTGGLPWAHLDIAGPARATGDAGVVTRGATGYGARLLARWLEDVAAAPAEWLRLRGAAPHRVDASTRRAPGNAVGRARDRRPGRADRAGGG